MSEKARWRCRLGLHRWKKGPFRVIPSSSTEGIAGIAVEYACQCCAAKKLR